jgi:hypothetical protein
MAKKYRWGEREKRDRMFDLLRDRALDFATELKTHSYHSLKVKMTRRFSEKEDPIVARRELIYIQQKDDETLAEYSGRVHLKVIRGHPQANQDTVEQMAVESFLKGCKNKEAAASAMDKNPKSVYAAVKKVKAAINNRKALYGTKASFSSKKVSFADIEEDTNISSADDLRIRQVRPIGKSATNTEQSNPADFAKLAQVMEKHMQAMEKVSRRLEDLETKQERSRSPAPSPVRSAQKTDQCYKCKQYGHFRRDCQDKSPQSSPRRPIICFRCSQPGHIGSNCPNKVTSPGRPATTATSN